MLDCTLSKLRLVSCEYERSHCSLLLTSTKVIEYDIFGEGSQISTNKKRENSAFWLLIGLNLTPFPGNTALSYNIVVNGTRARGSMIFTFKILNMLYSSHITAGS